MRLLAVFVVAMFIALPARAEETVTVHLRADSDAVRIVRVDGDHPGEVCSGLCDKPLPRDGVYRIAGDGVSATQPFALAEGGADLTLCVDAGSSVQRVAGVAATLAGGASLIFALGYGDLLTLSKLGDHEVSVSHDRLFVGTLTAGLVVGVVGIVMIATSGTAVTTSHGISFSGLTLTPGGLLF